ncbi:alpha/beta fold hydrolase [Rugosimonospora africana]|uniref:Alpha/beta hydrolase n=1 Tax=Rugosimonospora africana TaxID=556532 RepID=A0A8J3VRM1_9ACTN|nr:alpha/beta hydrolase [Rugosimonospora africana]GIH16360.1 alpha/beta hydrolase [Rugosimonospora africana]
MFNETMVRVCHDPLVMLFVASTAGPAERALLVIHGGPDWDHSYLREPLSQWGDRCRILLPDLRGCGRSTRDLSKEEYTWDAMVADLVALLDATGTSVTDVLGFSTGGLIAQRLALAAPHRIRRLVIASSSVLPVPADAFAAWQERDNRYAAGADLGPDPTGLSGPDLVRAWARTSAPVDVWRPEALPDHLQRLDAVRFSGDWADLWQAGVLPSARPENALQRLAALGIPILLLHGRYDMTFPAQLAVQTAAQIPVARAVILDEAGHMAHIDQPDQWLTALADFLH